MALTTTAAIVSAVSPVLCAIAVCAGGIGLSLPNDSGFWAVSRFFHLNETDTIRGWTAGGFVAGVSILLFTCILSLFQGFLPGLVRFDAAGKEVCLLLKTGFFFVSLAIKEDSRYNSVEII